MKIRTRFIINIVVLASILLVVAAAMVVTNRSVRNMYQRQELAAQIEHEAYELGYLANDYLLYRESQQGSRWESKYALFSDHLSNLQVDTPEQQALLARIKSNQQRLKAVFDQVKASIETAQQTQAAGLDEKFMQVSWGRLEGQNQGMIFDASQLEGLLSEQEHRLEQQARLLSFALVGMLTIFVLVNYGLSFQRILRAIADLQDGTRIIGLGNLDFAIEVKNEDEIGELSYAFNRMTAMLADKDARLREQAQSLEKKVQERTRELQQAHAQLLRAEEIGQIGSWMWYVPENRLSFSEGLHKLLGLTAQDSGDTVESYFEQVLPEDREQMQQAIQGALQKRGPFEVEVRLLRKDGRVGTFYARGECVLDEKGNATRLMGVAIDITERKLAEVALRESEYKFSNLFGKSAIPSALTRLSDHVFVDVNEAWLRLFGYEREETLGKTAIEIGVNRDLQHRGSIISEVQERHQIRDLEQILFTKSGEPRTILTNVNAIMMSGQEYAITSLKDITERKQAEAALRQSEETYSTLFDNSPFALSLTRMPENVLVDVNGAFIKLFGFTREELIGKTSVDLGIADAESRAQIRAEFQTHGLVHDFEVIRITKTGERRFLSLNLDWVYISGEKHILTTIRDITGRKQAEEALQQKEADLREAQRIAHIGSWYWDARTDVTMGSDELLRIYGFDPATQALPDFKEQRERCYPAEDWERVNAAVQRTLETGIGYELDVQAIRNGAIIWITTRSEIVHNTDGHIIGLRGTVQDITERRQVENTLRKKQSEIRSLYESMTELFMLHEIVYDAAGKPTDYRILECNLAFERSTGIQRNVAIGGLVSRVFGTGEAPYLDIYARVVETGQPVDFETEFSPLGKYFHISAFSPETGRFATLTSDITERRQAEEEITSLSKFPTENPYPILRVQNDGRITYANAASHELLALWGCEINGYTPAEFKDLINVAVDTASDKTVDVPCNDKVYSITLVPIVDSGYVNLYGRDITERQRAEEELHRLTEDLRRSNAELEQFAYVASHDLQEPLRMVSSYVQLLSKRYQGRLDQDADEFIGFAVDGAKRMQNLINDLLTFSRIDTRGKPPVPTSCEDAIEVALSNLQIAIEESGASITHETLPVVKGDPTQLVQLFQNLLSNAIKFRAIEPPRIHVGVQQDAGEWLFRISDNGIGLDPKFAERIFVIFQRLHQGDTYPGTGMGLAICKRIVQRHGGRIWVESQSGKGATFYFTLPIKETE